MIHRPKNVSALLTMSVLLAVASGCPPPVVDVDPQTEPSLGESSDDQPTTGVTPTGGSTADSTGSTGTTGPSSEESTNATDPGATTGADSEPREPIAPSVLAIFEDGEGQRIPGAWIQPLPFEDFIPFKKNNDELPTPVKANADGVALLEALPSGMQRWILGAPGFATRTIAFTIDSQTQTFNKFKLTRLAAPVQFDTSVGVELPQKNAMVRLPPGPMINKRTGEQVTGPVQAVITVINPSEDDEPAPIPLIGTGLDGVDTQLDSFGMIGVELTSMAGEPLELKDDVLATVSIELSDEMSQLIEARALTTIPAWHADSSGGETKWTEVGNFWLEKNDMGRFVATVYDIKKFSWINMDSKAPEPRCYIVKTIDAVTMLPVNDLWVNVKTDFYENAGPTSGDGTACFDIGPNEVANITIEDYPPFAIQAKQTDPKSVCVGNWWADPMYPQGNCTVVEFEVNGEDLCVPGSTWDCSNELPWLWDEDKKDKGVCKPAQKICEEGKGWSACKPPIGPTPEICSPLDQAQFDENCDGVVNDDDPMDQTNSCQCTQGQINDKCYLGEKADINPNNMCAYGMQMCDGGFWTACEGDTPPNYAGEDCVGKSESCQDKPCDFDPLWSNTAGTVGAHSTIAMRLEAPGLTIVNRIVNGDTTSYGTCFQPPMKFDAGFSGLAMARYSQNEPPACFDENIVVGNIVGAVADSRTDGTVIAGKSTTGIDADVGGVSLGCQLPVGPQKHFATRYSNVNDCIYRIETSDPSVTIKSVAVGDDSTVTYVAGSIPLNVGGTIGPCPFNPGVARGYIARVSRTGNIKQCDMIKFVNGETPDVIDVSGSNLSMVTHAGNNIKVHLRHLATLDPVWAPVNAAVLANGATLYPLSVASHGEKVAFVGHGTGLITLIGQPQHDAGPDPDFVLVVADTWLPTFGTSVIGEGVMVDSQDFGAAVEWVKLADPNLTYGLMVTGSSLGNNFAFDADNCKTMTNPEPGVSWDSFIGLLNYQNGAVSCIDQHPLTGIGTQRVSSMAISDIKVAIGGTHDYDVIVAGEPEPEHEAMDGLQSAFQIVTVNPVHPAM